MYSFDIIKAYFLVEFKGKILFLDFGGKNRYDKLGRPRAMT